MPAKLNKCVNENGEHGYQCNDGECHVGHFGREAARKEVYAILEAEAKAKQTLAGTFVVTEDVKPALTEEVITTPTDDVEDFPDPSEEEIELEAQGYVDAVEDYVVGVDPSQR